MKVQIIQRFTATLTNGSVVEVCCGPALSKMMHDVVGYRPLGPQRDGVCCHWWLA